jgi:hypothetical protein
MQARIIALAAHLHDYPAEARDQQPLVRFAADPAPSGVSLSRPFLNDEVAVNIIHRVALRSLADQGLITVVEPIYDR